MPSPFPGMDPYLEGPLWTSVHTQLSVEIARQLSPMLRPRYVARTPKRFVIATAEDEDDITVSTADTYPDVSVAKTSDSSTPFGSTAFDSSPLQLATVMPAAIPHVTVEIRDVANQQLVTAIEVLSPTNKRGRGREEYVERRERFLLSADHLIEIDLLRTGQRVPMVRKLPSAPYFVVLSRAKRRPIIDVWRIQLNEILPTIPIPLANGDADVPLDLRRAMASVYDEFNYDLDIDYGRPPHIALNEADAAWAREQIATWRGSSR
ncbi:MAG TPA: DUF4058 family protein [Humisphaera sp.]|nr:DUF4058 family protein [Humisphaera sp.]